MEIKLIQNEYENEIVDLILNIQQKEFNVPITLEDQPDLLNIKTFILNREVVFWALL